MGLFDFLKKKPSVSNHKEQDAMAIMDKVDPKYRQMKADLDYQNALLERVNAAREKYKVDKDLESAIKEYEFAFVNSNPPCRTSQDIDLANLYIKAGLYDKAWGYLNQLELRRNYPDPEIRLYQARILRNEGKYAYAIEMFAIGYYYKSIPDNAFQSERFLKDISSSAKKLGWTDERKDELVKIVMTYPHKDNSAERQLVEHMRAFMKEDYQA